MFKRLLILLVLAIGAFLAVAALQPSEFEVKRTLVINAPARSIYDKVNDLEQWANWSPWAKLDPNAKTRFERTTRGIGATMHWEGNQDVGSGSMRIVDSEVAKRVVLELNFLKPFKSQATSTFTFEQEATAPVIHDTSDHDHDHDHDHGHVEESKTTVTWSMKGENNFLGKIMSLVINCDKMIGDKHEEGLTNLKALSESGSEPKE